MFILKTTRALKQIDNKKQNFQSGHRNAYSRHSNKELPNRPINQSTKVGFVQMQR